MNNDTFIIVNEDGLFIKIREDIVVWDSVNYSILSKEKAMSIIQEYKGIIIRYSNSNYKCIIEYLDNKDKLKSFLDRENISNN